MSAAYETPQIISVGTFAKDTAFTSKGYWTDVLGWWF
ncbi:lasso RiPP family leader peptide-containing protein [Leifsonia sp. TF02-11]|nr:lasso RiPP family leader peptide-containing protein [Leifsonia sp. TF02-11]MBO1739305.1 lasso RiPP family leader peptide-containing protein [Leifsonia sp. TF02-11]